MEIIGSNEFFDAFFIFFDEGTDVDLGVVVELAEIETNSSDGILSVFFSEIVASGG